MIAPVRSAVFALVWSTLAPVGQLSRLEAAPPEFLATVGPGYTQLTTDGHRLWAARHGVTRRVRLVAEGGAAVSGGEIVLPEHCVHVAAAPDGVLYALSVGRGGIDARLWERAPDSGTWTQIGAFGEGGGWFSPHARILPLAERVILSLPREQWAGDGLSGPTGHGWVALVDRITYAQTIVRQEVMGILEQDGRLYGTRHGAVPGGFSITAVKSADGGFTWTELAPDQRPLNEAFPTFLLGGPQAVGADRLFSLGVFGGAVVVRREGGASMAYALPAASTMDCLGMRVAREGESWIGFFRERNAAGDSWDRETVSVSHNYLRDFEAHPMDDLGHLDAVALADGFYLLRETIGGSALYRVALPAERLPVVETPQLRIAAGERDFFDPLLGASVPRPTLEITLPGAAGVSYQLRTSTDLLNWEPLGLPIPAGQVEAVLADPSVPRRFFK